MLTSSSFATAQIITEPRRFAFLGFFIVPLCLLFSAQSPLRLGSVMVRVGNMVTAAPKPCRRAGCSALVYGGNGYCPRHQADAEREWAKAPERSGRGGRQWRRLRLQVLERDGWLCQCDDCATRPVPLVAHEVDHISNERDADGALDDSLENLRSMNRDCHRKKTQQEAARGRRSGWRRAFG